MAERRLSFLSHCVPRSLWPLWDRRTTWAMLGLLTLIGGLYLWQAGEVAAARYRIEELETERVHWQRQNAELWKEITELTSAAALTGRAESLGFTLPQEEMYLNSQAGNASGSSTGSNP